MGDMEEESGDAAESVKSVPKSSNGLYNDAGEKSAYVCDMEGQL